MSTQVQERLTVALGNVFDALNVLGSDNSSLVREVFTRQHRTLQQSFVRVIAVPVLQELAEAHKAGRVDGRNRGAAKLAHDLLESVEEGDLWLPLI